LSGPLVSCLIPWADTPYSWGTNEYRFKTREEALRFLSSQGLLASSIESYNHLPKHHLTWTQDGVVRTSRDGTLPPEGANLTVGRETFSIGTTGLCSEIPLTVSEDLKAFHGIDVGEETNTLKEPEVKSWGVPGATHQLYKTRAEAELHQSRFSQQFRARHSVKSSPLPATHQLSWCVAGVWYGSKEGLLPTGGFYFSLIDEPTLVTTKAKEESWVSIHRPGIRFKTRAEADFWVKDFFDLPSNEVCSTALEANRQLWWKIGGVEFGSKDGLMPPTHLKEVYAFLIANTPGVTTKALPPEEATVESLKAELVQSKLALQKARENAKEYDKESYRRGVEFERARHETMGVVTNTGKLTWEEVQAARTDGKLYVSDDNLGSVPTEWLTQYRSTQATKGDETSSNTFFGVLGAAALLGGLLSKKSPPTQARVESVLVSATSEESESVEEEKQSVQTSRIGR